ncbi:MAG: PIN domain-containing protein [Spirochaetes bacterium]|nr:PIN domain-containing protein [Spirochaetota bacterium]
MILWDVNLWVYAFRPDSPLHEPAYNELQTTLVRREPFIFLPNVAASFLRLVTNPRIFRSPSALDEAWHFIDILEEHPAAFHADVDTMTFGIFKHLCLLSSASGNEIPDVLLAASAIRHDATFCSADRGFSRFPALRFSLLDK